MTNSPSAPTAPAAATPFGVRHWFYVMAAALAFVLAPLSPASADISLTFGTYAADKPTATVRKFKPFLNFLSAAMSEELGEPVTIKMRVARSYEDGVDQLATGAVDFSRFGPASYVTVKERNPGIAIVAMESKKGAKRFKGVIAVHETDQSTSLSTLVGRSFAFGDELSTIGRYLSQAHLLDAGVSAETLDSHAFLGRHDAVGEAVGSGRFDAGALKESTFKKLVAKGVPIRALYTFDNVTKPWLAHPNMPPKVLEAMRKVMLTSTDAPEVQSIAKSGFLEGGDADYDFIRKAMERSLAF